MPNITSTMSTPVEYVLYQNTAGGESRAKRSITIQGGANVATKHFQTPDGVVTHVTDDELAILELDATFNTHLNNGFVKIHKTSKKQVKDLEKEDDSAPLTPKSYVKKGKKAPKTTAE